MNASEFSRYISLIESGKKIEAELLRLESIPNLLIKHVSLNGDKSDEKKLYSLENNKLWFSAISKLNDPYEFKGMIVDEKKFKDAGYPNDYIERFRDFLKMEEYGVVCFSSRDVDYLPMWAYYTNNYQGYCIEYEAVKKSCIHQVMYENNRVQIAGLFFQLYDELKEVFKQGKTTSPKSESIGNIIRQNLYLKSKSWEHEQEYRIAMPISNPIGENFEIADLGLKVNRIIAGVNCSKENLDRLNNISNTLGCGNIYTSMLSDTKYGMDIRRM